MSTKEDFHSQTDLYEILGVERHATQDEIRKSYNELILMYHPDKGGNVKKFKDLQIAYKILSNEKNREQYTKSLSATFEEISQDYRDPQKGGRQTKIYEKTENDFMNGKTDDEIKQKKEEFMKCFDERREQNEKEFYTSLKKNIETQSQTPCELSYQVLLKQRDEELMLPTIDCLMTDKFDVNMFNQMFEQNKQSQTTDVEPYHEPLEQTRTDLAPISESGLFTNNDAEMNVQFQTYQTSRNLDESKYNPNLNVTKTRDIIYEDLKSLHQKKFAEREAFVVHLRDEQIKIEFTDANPLSYHQMGFDDR